MDGIGWMAVEALKLAPMKIAKQGCIWVARKGIAIV